MPRLLRDGVRRGPVVAGQHDDLDALGRQRLQRVRRRCLHRIGNGEQSRELAVDGDVDHGRAVAAQTLALFVQRLRVDAERLQEVRIAEHDGLAVDLAGRALAGRRVELLHLAEIEIALLGRRARWRRPADVRSRARRSRPAAEYRSRQIPRPERSRPPSACLRSACPSCRPPACRPSPCAPALRRS